METVTGVVESILTAMPGFLLAFIFLLFSKVFYDLTTVYKFNKELTENDNPAFGICFGGYLAGSGIAMAGALFGIGESLEDGFLNYLLDDFFTILVGGITVILLMRLSVFINDKLILHKFDINKEMIKDRNLGTGYVVAGGCIATGLMLNGVLSGNSDSLLTGIRDIAVYWLLGQALLILGGFVFQKITSYDIHKTIEEDDNAAAGLSFGGFLVALGIIIRASLAGATSSLIDEIITTVVVALFGIILLACVRVIADKIFLPKSPLSKEIAKDKNCAAAAVAVASYICTAVLLAAVINLNPGGEVDVNAGIDSANVEVQLENESGKLENN